MSQGLNLSLRLPVAQVERPNNGEKFVLPKWACKPSCGAALHVTKNGETLSTLRLDEHVYFMLGRSPKVGPEGHGFTINHPTLSRQHAVIVHGADETLYIIDLDTKAGTWVNKERLQPYCPKLLENANILTLGHSTRRYVVRLFPMECQLFAANKGNSSMSQRGFSGLRVSTPGRSGAGCDQKNSNDETHPKQFTKISSPKGSIAVTGHAEPYSNAVATTANAATRAGKGTPKLHIDGSGAPDGESTMTNDDDDDDDDDEEDEVSSPFTLVESRQRNANLRQAKWHSGLNAMVAYPSPKSMLGRRDSDSPVSPSLSAADMAAAVAATASPVASPVIQPQVRSRGNSGLGSNVETFPKLPPTQLSLSDGLPKPRARSLSTSCSFSSRTSIASPRGTTGSGLLVSSPTLTTGLQLSHSLPSSSCMDELSLEPYRLQHEAYHRVVHPHHRSKSPFQRSRSNSMSAAMKRRAPQQLLSHATQRRRSVLGPCRRVSFSQAGPEVIDATERSPTSAADSSHSSSHHMDTKEDSPYGPQHPPALNGGSSSSSSHALPSSDSSESLTQTASASIGSNNNQSTGCSKNNCHDSDRDFTMTTGSSGRPGKLEIASDGSGLSSSSEASTSSNMSERVYTTGKILMGAAFLPRNTSTSSLSSHSSGSSSEHLDDASDGSAPVSKRSGHAPPRLSLREGIKPLFNAGFSETKSSNSKRRDLSLTPSAMLGVSPEGWPSSPAALRARFRNPHTHSRSSHRPDQSPSKNSSCDTKLHQAFDNLCEELSPKIGKK